MNKIHFHEKYYFCFFSRNGGVSKSEFSSLNCAYNKGDINENVSMNRKIALELFKKKKLVIPNQTHSNIVLQVNKHNKLLEADAVISDRDDLLLGILTADCAPIIVLGKKLYGIIHVGWKGLLNNIIENTINKIVSKGENAKNINIFVGPHLKKNSFEVKDDFIKILKEKKIDPEKFVMNKKKKFYFDFTKLIKSKLKNSEISKLNISNDDTFNNPNHFFSHRYCHINKIKNCGRQISLVGIKNI